MPKLYAPRDMTIVAPGGTGVTLKAGETKMVGKTLFAAGLQQGAYPAPEEYQTAPSAAMPQPPMPQLVERRDTVDTQADLSFIERPGLDNATIIEDDDEDLPTAEELARYPTGALIAETQVEDPPPPPPPPTLEDRVADAYRRIIARNEKKDFNDSGVPKSTALSRELGGELVDLETREKVWDAIAKELQK